MWHRLKVFRSSESGSQSVEAVIILPLLFWAVTATLVYFDAFRSRNDAARATFTVTDLISRETGPVDAAYLRGVQHVIGQLSGSATDPRVRVTLLRCVADCDDEARRELEVVWSRARGGLPEIRQDQTAQDGLRARIPAMSQASSVIMVESEIDWVPWFNVGLQARPLASTVVMRPRFSPQICWETCERS
ncbi:TadE/TadG family type IV pilus assembly protein [Histidinibacterium lentulum]|uniref:Pilus assembly protein n=1 Tax=Histidinibacterium lentulum TaxID=2480588 RepID=A0A3N2QYP3_9RHOB|nr:hypothetical protein [Histidinibacterium lentulum]ROU00238.1 hypothetical protein EAT49_13365 [Histidinibacterium lentulum]